MSAVYFTSEVMSDYILISVISISTGIFAAAWHTIFSLLLGLLISVVIRWLLFGMSWKATLLGILYYFMGWFIGTTLYRCNREWRWTPVRQPWLNTARYASYLTERRARADRTHQAQELKPTIH